MEQRSENPKKSFIAIVCVLLGLLSLIPGWGFITLPAIILAIVILKSGRFTSDDKKMALSAVILSVIGIALLSLRTYSYIKTDTQSRQEYAYTAEDVKKDIFYSDSRCNIGIALRAGVYEGSDYPCSGKIFKNVSFQIYDNLIAMGDLNNDNRADAAIVVVKQYDEEERIIEIAGFVNSILFGADKRQLVFNGSEELSNVSRIEGLKIESGIIVLNFVVCCPTQEKVGTYVIDEVYRTLKPIQLSDISSSSWQTYRNEEYGFEFKYPTEFSLSEKMKANAPGLIDSSTLGNLQQRKSALAELVVQAKKENGELVVFSVVNKTKIGFSTKVGVYGYDSSLQQWKDFLDGNFENLCMLRRKIGQSYAQEENAPLAYSVDANMMPESYPRNDIVLTDRAYGVGIFRTCGDNGCDEGSLETQEKIAASFRLLNNIQNVAPNCY